MKINSLVVPEGITVAFTKNNNKPDTSGTLVAYANVEPGRFGSVARAALVLVDVLATLEPPISATTDQFQLVPHHAGGDFVDHAVQFHIPLGHALPKTSCS